MTDATRRAAFAVAGALLLASCGGVGPVSPSLPPVAEQSSPPSAIPPAGAPLGGTDMPELAAQGRSIRVPILMYHHIKDPKPEATAAQRRYIVRPAVFRQQLQWLKSHGYRPITLDQFSRAVHGQDVTLPEKPVIITIDDGFNDGARIAAPILEEEGFTAVYFIVVDHVQAKADDRPTYGHVDWEQLRALVAAGHEVQPHSLTHPLLAKVPREQMLREVVDSKRIMEEQLGVKMRFFCYPYGSVNDEVRQALRDAGYELGLTIRAGVEHPVGAGFMDVERIETQEDMARFEKYVTWNLAPKGAAPPPDGADAMDPGAGS